MTNRIHYNNGIRSVLLDKLRCLDHLTGNGNKFPLLVGVDINHIVQCNGWCSIHLEKWPLLSQCPRWQCICVPFWKHQSVRSNYWPECFPPCRRGAALCEYSYHGTLLHNWPFVCATGLPARDVWVNGVVLRFKNWPPKATLQLLIMYIKSAINKQPFKWRFAIRW